MAQVCYTGLVFIFIGIIKITVLLIMHPIIARARSEIRIFLTEIESKELLRQAGINTIDTRLATSGAEAVSISKQLGFPVVQ